MRLAVLGTEWEMQVESWRGPPRLWTEPGSQEGSQVALVVKHPPASAGDERDASSIPGSGRSAGGGPGHPLQCSSLENAVARGAWRPTVQRVSESDSTEGT